MVKRYLEIIRIFLSRSKKHALDTTGESFMIAADGLDSVGYTPVVEIRKAVPPHCARILVKLE